MDPKTFGMLIAIGGVLAVVAWVLHKIGRALAAIAETLAAAAVVFMALWWVLKALGWLGMQLVTRWRTCLVLLALAARCRWLGWPSLAITAGSMASVLASWWLIDTVSFDHWCGRVLRSWWMRWALYHRKLPKWLHACGLSISDGTVPLDVTVTLVGRRRRAARATAGRRAVEIPRSARSAPARPGTRFTSSWCPGRSPRTSTTRHARWQRPAR